MACFFTTRVWHLHILYGFLPGITLGIAACPVTTAVGFYFERYRTMALALTFAGGGLGIMVYPPLMNFLISTYGWRGAVLLLAALNLHIVPLGMCLRPIQVARPTAEKPEDTRPSAADLLAQTEGKLIHESHIDEALDLLNGTAGPPPAAGPEPFDANSDGGEKHALLSAQEKGENNQEKADGAGGVANGSGAVVEVAAKAEAEDRRGWRRFLPKVDSVLRDVRFWLFGSSVFCWWIGTVLVMIMLNDMAVSRGVSKQQAAWLVSSNGLSNAVGRVLVGVIASHPKISRQWLYNGCTAFHGAATLLYMIHADLPAYISFTVLFGLSYGMKLAIVAAIMIDMFTIQNLSSVYGYTMFIAGMASLIGPTFTGWLFDVTGSYDISFLLGGVATLVGTVLYGAAQWLDWRRRRDARLREEREEEARLEALRKKSIIEMIVSTV